MGRENLPWKLTIPSDVRLLVLARTFVEMFCQILGCSQAATDAVLLATNEAANNIIRHAHQGHPEAPLQIECYHSPEGIEVRLLDEGEPFDLDAVPDLDPSELRVGGRGVYMMRALMDELSCQPRGERGNTLRMVKRCVPDSSRCDSA